MLQLLLYVRSAVQCAVVHEMFWKCSVSHQHNVILNFCHLFFLSGTIGHVAHGKSTVVKAISGVQTVRFKNELERNITIKLGK
jgi:hypothetical protein